MDNVDQKLRRALFVNLVVVVNVSLFFFRFFSLSDLVSAIPCCDLNCFNVFAVPQQRTVENAAPVSQPQVSRLTWFST